jgi:hypothetical protein
MTFIQVLATAGGFEVSSTLDGDAIDLTVYEDTTGDGSANNQETFTLTGGTETFDSGNFDLSAGNSLWWTASASDDTDITTSGDVQSFEEAGATLTWTSDADLEESQDDSGYAHESIASTPNDDAGEIRRGYSYQDNPDSVYDSGLVGWWPLTDESAQDYSGNGNDGTNAYITTGVAGRSGIEAFEFDGINTKIDTGNSTNYNTQTFSAWIRPERHGNDFGNIFSKNSYYASSESDFPIHFNVRDGNVSGQVDEVLLGLSSGNDFIRDTEIGGAITYNEWQHVVGIHRDNGVCEVWVDGTQVASTTITYAISDNSRPLTIGASAFERDGGTDENEFQGVMCDLRHYDRALSSQEIQTLYEWGSADLARPPGASENGVARYALDGDATDSFGTNDGAESGITYSSDSIRGQSAIANGNSEYIDTGIATLTPPITVSLWAKADINNSEMPFGNWNSTSDDFYFQNDVGDWKVQHDADGTGIEARITGASVEDGWSHLVSVIDGSELKLYLNGYLGASSADTNTSTIDNGNNFYICNTPGTSHAMTYPVDEVRIYDRALSQREVFELYRWGTFGRDMRKDLVTK